MPLLINLRHLEPESLELAGQLPAADLDLEGVDELIHVSEPLDYKLEVQKLDKSILAQGDIKLTLKCECARCLKPFDYQIDLEGWACLLPLEGDEQVPVLNDSIDLTPYIREDILLGFPQHPLCKAECGGLPKKAIAKVQKAGGASQAKEKSSTWAELNKLKF